VSNRIVVSAVVVLALSLRLSVNAIGALLPQIRADLGLSATAAGVLNALPEVVFALVGLLTPALAFRYGRHRLVFVALIVALLGQVLRVSGHGVGTLFAGTVLTLLGPAIGNVLLPGLIREHFPDRITAMTAVYVTILSLGAAIGSGLTIPVQHAAGGSWRAGLVAWAGVGVLAVVPWALAARSAHDAARPSVRTTRVTSLLGSRLAWTMAGFFALQAAQVYVVLGWLGQVLQDDGVSEVTAGALLATAPIIGIALSLCTPILLRAEHRIRPLAFAFGVCYLLGYSGLVVAPNGGAVLWMVLLGLGGGTFPMALTLVALRAPDADGVIALSAFTQCVGYLLASLGPLAFGLLHDLTDSWQPSLVLMVASLVPLVGLGVSLGREGAGRLPRPNDIDQIPERIDLVVEA
jgi:CP family cyanate transporter-like MFS transporter